MIDASLAALLQLRLHCLHRASSKKNGNLSSDAARREFCCDKTEDETASSCTGEGARPKAYREGTLCDVVPERCAVVRSKSLVDLHVRSPTTEVQDTRGLHEKVKSFTGFLKRVQSNTCCVAAMLSMMQF